MSIFLATFEPDPLSSEGDPIFDYVSNTILSIEFTRVSNLVVVDADDTN